MLAFAVGPEDFPMNLAQGLVPPSRSDAPREAPALQIMSKGFERQLGVVPPVLNDVDCQGQYLPDR